MSNAFYEAPEECPTRDRCVKNNFLLVSMLSNQSAQISRLLTVLDSVCVDLETLMKPGARELTEDDLKFITRVIDTTRFIRSKHAKIVKDMHEKFTAQQQPPDSTPVEEPKPEDDEGGWS